jgi:hypothetical protein
VIRSCVASWLSCRGVVVVVVAVSSVASIVHGQDAFGPKGGRLLVVTAGRFVGFLSLSSLGVVVARRRIERRSHD